jgi:tetratricopeptide (TPR) repeat protein
MTLQRHPISGVSDRPASTGRRAGNPGIRPFLGAATIAAAMLLSCASATAAAFTRQQVLHCNNMIPTSPDAQLAACHAMLNSGNRVTTQDMAAFKFRLGEAYYRKNDFEHALSELDQSLALHPARLVMAGAFIFRGLAHAGRQDMNRAIADLTEAIRLKPEAAAVLTFSRGELYRTKSEPERALADFNEAVRLDPKNAMFLSRRGNMYLLFGDRERAAADADNALQRDPKSTLALQLRGSVKLDAQWRQYLKQIQDDDDYANWPGPPFDSFSGTKFASPGGQKPAEVAKPSSLPKPVGGADQCALAAVHWQSAESIATVATFEDHLARFPDCTFAGLARARIDALKPSKAGACGPRQVEKNSECVDKTCAPGLTLDAEGDCVKSKAGQGTTRPTRRAAAPARPIAAASPPNPVASVIQSIPDSNVRRIIMNSLPQPSGTQR